MRDGTHQGACIWLIMLTISRRKQGDSVVITSALNYDKLVCVIMNPKHVPESKIVLDSCVWFWILGCVLHSGTCFGSWSVFGFWHLLCLYEPPYSCEAFFVFLPREFRPFFEDVLCCMACDCLYSRHWRQVFHQFTLDGAENTGLVTTHNFHRSKERYTVETVIREKKKLSVSSL